MQSLMAGAVSLLLLLALAASLVPAWRAASVDFTQAGSTLRRDPQFKVQQMDKALLVEDNRLSRRSISASARVCP